MRIRTKDKELYSKLKSLNYTDEIIVKSKKNSLGRIMKSLNSKGQNVKAESLGDRTIIKRLKPLNIKTQYIRR